jgi:NADH-quinone oxidoreductase subunit N
MAHDLSFLIPEILVLLTAAGTLVFEMLRLPRTALAVAVAGLLLATALTLPLLGVDTSVFSGTFRIDTLSIWAKLILLPATVLSLLGPCRTPRQRPGGDRLQPALLHHLRRPGAVRQR